MIVATPMGTTHRKVLELPQSKFEFNFEGLFNKLHPDPMEE